MLGVAAGTQLRRVIREAELLVGRALPDRVEGLATAAVGLLAALSVGVIMTPEPARPPAEGGSYGSVRVEGSASSRGAAGTHAAATSGRGSRRDGDTRPTGSGTNGSLDRPGTGTDSGSEDPGTFPGARSYRVSVTDDTYLQGEVEVEIVGGTDIDRATEGPPPGPGSVDCTVAPGDSGASCTHTGEESRGVRAHHSGEAYVAGKRVY